MKYYKWTVRREKEDWYVELDVPFAAYDEHEIILEYMSDEFYIRSLEEITVWEFMQMSNEFEALAKKNL